MKPSVQWIILSALCSSMIIGCENDADVLKTTECDGKCSSEETCDNGVCKCGEDICDGEQVCKNGVCTSNTPSADPCGGKCSGEETCDNGVCKCGNDVCSDHQTCTNGTCEDRCEGDACDEINCNASCTDGQICFEGQCIKDNVCVPDCDETETCIDSKCVPQIVDPCSDVTCEGESICMASDQTTQCYCGSVVCGPDQICAQGTCKWKDPCHDIKCDSTEACVDGICVGAIRVDSTEFDVMLSSSSALTVTKATTDKLTWKLDKAASNLLFCKVSGENKYVTADEISKCVEYNDKKMTETVTFVSRQRLLDHYKLTLSNRSNNSVNVDLTLKPYFDDNNFLKMASGEVYPNGLTYRNCLCPGQKFKSEYDTHIASGGADTKSINLGGTGNNNSFHTFTSEEVKVLDQDMFEKYIKPNMLKSKDSAYYGSRASVVAAARFLILQFPYDIPYFITNNGNLGASHYIWSNLEKATQLNNVAVYGLNLDTNMYNANRKTINSNIQRWGDIVSHKIKIETGSRAGEYKTDKDKSTDYEFAGLECSGFVTWAFRNGRLGLGDWTTHFFGNHGGCYANSDGTLTSTKTDKPLRNYRCKSIANGTRTGYGTRTANNELNGVHAKLNGDKDINHVGLKESDFIALNPMGIPLTESELRSKIKDVKAGDLLWNGEWVSDSNYKQYSSGHVGMIIGVKRDSSGDVTALYVGEAVHRSGNTLSKYPTLKDFVEKSSWMTNKKRAAFIIKMDSVYDYYSNKYGITDESAKSDCPSGKKSGGNCYNYTDMFNETFNNAITVISVKKS